MAARLLAVTPAPEPFELMSSYLLRLACANGLRSPVSVCGRLRPGASRRWIGFGFSAEDLAEVTGWSTSVLAEITESCAYQNGTRTVRKLAERLVSEQFRRIQAPAFCAMCAQESGYIERVWGLSAMRACPLHACWAVTSCSFCGRPPYWERRSFSHCPCGEPYIASIRPDAPPTAELAGAEVVLRAVTQRRAPGYPEKLGFPVELRELSLRHTLRLQSDLARLVRTVESATVDDENSPGSVALSGKVLGQWPRSFTSLLEKYRTSAGAEAVVRLLFDRKMGLFSRYQIDHAMPGRCLSFLAEAVFDFIDGDAPVFVDPRVQSHLFGKRRSRWRSLSYSARMLGIGTQKLNQLVDAGQMGAGTGDIARNRVVDPTCIKNEQVRALFRVHLHDAARATGLPARTLRAALDADLFPTSCVHRQRRGVPLGDIDQINRALAAAATRTRVRRLKSSGRRHKTIGEVLKSSRYSTDFKVAMIKRLMDERLVGVAKRGESFRDVTLDIDCLTVELGLSPRAKALSPRYLDATQVAQMLWCSTVAVRQLLKNGHLEEVDRKHYRKISVKSCRKFQRSYISARELGDALGWPQRSLVRRLGILRHRPALLRLSIRAGWFLKRSSLPPLGQLAEQLLRQR